MNLSPFNLSNDQVTDIIEFWFSEFKTRWFKCSPEDDHQVSTYFHILDYYFNNLDYESTNNQDYSHNESCEIQQTRTVLAFILIYDQFYRHHRRCFQEPTNIDLYNTMTVEWSHYLINNNLLIYLTPEQQCFALLPLRHSRKIDQIKLSLQIISELAEINSIQIYKRFLNAGQLDLEKALYQIGYQYNKETVNKSDNIQKQTLDSDIYSIIDFDHYSLLTRLMIRTNIISLSIYQPEIPDINSIIYHHLKSFIIQMQREQKISKEVCISLSGGVDSLLLCYYLSLLRRELILDQVMAVHINYGNRLKSHLEALFIRKWCEKQDIPLYLREITEIKRAHSDTDLYDDKNNIVLSRNAYERYTRNIRFDLYRSIGMPVFLGHNRDDCFENILTNITKHQHYSNLSVMSPYTLDFDKQSTLFPMPILRPFLTVNKAEIIKEARNIGLHHTRNSTPPWSTRYRIRNGIIDTLAHCYPEFLLGLERLKDHLITVHLSRQQSLEQMLRNVVKETNVLQLKLESDLIDQEMFNKVVITLAHRSQVSVPTHKSLERAYKMWISHRQPKKGRITLNSYIRIVTENGQSLLCVDI